MFNETTLLICSIALILVIVSASSLIIKLLVDEHNDRFNNKN